MYDIFVPKNGKKTFFFKIIEVLPKRNKEEKQKSLKNNCQKNVCMQKEVKYNTLMILVIFRSKFSTK